MLPKRLVTASLLYLALPYLLFFTGWLQPIWVTLLGAILVVALWGAWRTMQQFTPAARAPTTALPTSISRSTFLLYLLLCAGWVFLAGAGGYGYQNSDWIKHDAILKDLIEQPWPVAYELYTLPVAQVYYTGFYLPAALVGKLGGWAAANLALYLWTLLGTLLAALWFGLLVRRIHWGVLLLFIAFSGLDAIGQIITTRPHNLAAIFDNWRALENWPTLMIHYSSNATLLFWVPQHALAGWISAGLTFYGVTQRWHGLKLLPAALSSLWSPFVTLGLVPYLLVDLLTQPERWPARIRAYFTLTNLGSIVILGVIGLFYAAKLGNILPFLASGVSHGWLLDSAQALDVLQLALFALLEFGLYVILVYLGQRATDARAASEPRWLLATTLLLLLLLPFYRFGLNNDLVMRASIPALFLLAVYVGQILSNRQVRPALRGLLLLLVLVGSVTALIRFIQQSVPLVNPSVEWANQTQEADAGIVELYADDTERLTQYIGNADAPFFNYLAKPIYLAQRPAHRYVLYDDKILFADTTLSQQDDLQPGQTVTLTTELHLLTAKIERNYSMSLRLLAEDGTLLWHEQSWPLNRPTSQPYEEIIWLDTRQITLPTTTAPGLYRLDLAFVDPVMGGLLPAQQLPGSVPVDANAPIGYLRVGPAATLDAEVGQELGGVGAGLAISGAQIAPAEQIAAGETLTVRLQWQARTDLDQNYVGFVHLLGPDGTLVAQWDQQPLGGFLPTSLWRAGFTLIDTYPIAIAPATPPGDYTLVAGMYDAVTQVRLPVTAPGQPPSDTFSVGMIEVR